ncbi:MAG: hypothetical protein HGA62_08770 [Chlorobiaceae bacterium]|nr:hypothetical protein [Chlorobiaceae bacterium]NTV60060.1 hypothetical protein [Chlorobiaceae bacterium]
MIIALLILIVLLLTGVIALLVTGWTLTEKNDIERIGQDIRRELAQQRADTVQLLHSMRIELEESIREVIEQKFNALEAMQSRGNSRRRKSATASREMHAGCSAAVMNGDEGAEGTEEEIVSRPMRGVTVPEYENDRQFLLFPEASQQETQRPSLEEQMRSLLEKPEPGVMVPGEILSEEKTRKKEDDEYISMIRILPASDLYDDIPDIESLPKIEELDRTDAVRDPKTIRIKSERYIDDIPDIEEL